MTKYDMGDPALEVRRGVQSHIFADRLAATICDTTGAIMKNARVVSRRPCCRPKKSRAVARTAP
jgi:hypothetical protein